MHSGRGAGGRRSATPRLHLGRLALLLLILIGASFYVGPVRGFFAQQDRHQQELAALRAARAENEAIKVQVRLLNSSDYIAQRARADSMLVPAGTQVFVIKGLPSDDAAPVDGAAAPAASPSVLERIGDLWRTLTH